MRGAGVFLLIMGAGVLAMVFFLCTMVYSYLFASKGSALLFSDFYECGFSAIPDSSMNLDIQFSALALIFLVYDMEMIILVPLVVNISSLPVFALIFVMLMLFILGISYWYEWERYTLVWGFN